MNTTEAKNHRRTSSWTWRVGAILTCVAAFALPVGGAAAVGAKATGDKAIVAYVQPSLLAAAQAHPKQTFDVIVQGTSRTQTADVESEVAAAVVPDGNAPAWGKRFRSISGVELELTGRQIGRLATKSRIFSITPNNPVRVASDSAYSNSQLWPYVSGAAGLWPSTSRPNLQASTIAIVDSGIDTSRADFGDRVVKSVAMTSLPNNSPGDGRGHGTFVASIAAGSAPGYAGAAPTAKLVSIDVADDTGVAMTSDVIAAADWILANKDTYGIKVANFSLHTTYPSSFRFDPLDKAVERLWFSGVFVVAAAGNYGTAGQPSGVFHAPGNDPFVMTVGAADIMGTIRTNDDVAAPWSAYGYTLDGFAKPEIAAPGRYMIGAVPVGSTLPQERPESVKAPGYMQLSGTSFSAPVVAGAAAYLMAMHPDWSPGQIKGVLMVTAKPDPAAAELSVGVGEVNLWRASVWSGSPPNANSGLDQFVVDDPLGGPTQTFDDAAWTSAAWTSAAWTSAAWTSAAWTSAAWSTAAWTSAAWTSAAWTSAAWTSAAWTSAAWTSAAWTSAAWTSAAWTSGSTEDTAGTDATDGDSTDAQPSITAADITQLAAELGLSPDEIPSP